MRILLLAGLLMSCAPMAPYAPVVMRSAQEMLALVAKRAAERGLKPEDVKIECENEWNPETEELLTLCTAHLKQ